MHSAWSCWKTLIRRIRSQQCKRLHLRLLRRFFFAWGSAWRLQCSVLSALSSIDAEENQGNPSLFVRVRHSAHASVQTRRPCIHASLSLVIHRLASGVLVIFIRAWRLAARRMRALRWGLKRLFARVFKVWAYRPKHFPFTDNLGTDDSDAANDEQRWWQLLISPKSSSASNMLPQSTGSSTAFSPSNNLAARTLSTANTVSRRLANSMHNPYCLIQDAVSVNHSTRIPSLLALLKIEALG
jgi:hypothetical protein